MHTLSEEMLIGMINPESEIKFDLEAEKDLKTLWREKIMAELENRLFDRR